MLGLSHTFQMLKKNEQTVRKTRQNVSNSIEMLRICQNERNMRGNLDNITAVLEFFA